MIVKFLKQVQLTANGTGGTKKFINIASFERIIPLETLQEKIRTHLTGDLTSEEQESLRMLEAAIKRRDNGTENSPFAIFHE
jgi:Na+-transporting NADH:ubiquinone oxidoreductase subunit NqrA